MMRNTDLLSTNEEQARLSANLFALILREKEARRKAMSKDRSISLEGQLALARKFRVILPFRLRRLPVDARGQVTDIMPVSPIRPKVCLRCGGNLDDQGQCVSGRYIMQRVGMYRQEARCKAVWRVA
jgi:hypothetical protein